MNMEARQTITSLSISLFLYTHPLLFIAPLAVDMEEIAGTAVSGVPTRKQGCRNEVGSEGVCTHTHTNTPSLK